MSSTSATVSSKYKISSNSNPNEGDLLKKSTTASTTTSTNNMVHNNSKFHVEKIRQKQQEDDHAFLGEFLSNLKNSSNDTISGNINDF